MREGWEVKTIGDVCEFQRGLTYTKSDEVDASDNIVLRASNINLSTNLLSFEELKYINDKVVIPANKIVKKGSLLICTASGSKSHLGKVAFIDDDYGYAFGGFMGMLTPLNGLLPKFLFHLMTSEGYKDFIGALSDGTNINNLKFDDLRRFLVPVPPLREQQRIVALLDEAFAGLVTAKANAERNLQNARAIFESHLQSVFSQRGEGWEENTMDLSELCEFIVDCEHKTAPVQDEGIPSIRTPNIGKGKLLLDGVNRVSEDTYKAWSRRAEPKPGDLILAREAPAGNVAVIPDGARVCLGQRTVLIRPKADIFDPFFLAYRLLEPRMQEKLLGHSRGATVQHVNMKDIRALDVGPIPPIRTQQEISGAIHSVSTEGDHLTRLYERKLAALEELKKSLLHQAFNGEL